MKVLNRRTMTCPFDEYIKLPGWSHSRLKQGESEPMQPTESMGLGTRVHNYLLTPEEYEFDDIEIIRPLALKLKSVLGDSYLYLKPEIAIMADFVHEGMCLNYLGRADLGIEDKIVVDLKVSKLKFESAMAYFRYDRPISGYCAGLNAPVGLMLSINPKTKETTLKNIPLQYGWWEQKIIEYGRPYNEEF